MFLGKRDSAGKFIVVGIDGAPFELIKDLSEKGVMPNLKKLIEEGSFVKTQVPLPEISSVSWTSFMTASNPGEHGVYGFMEINPEDYTFIFPSFPRLPVKTIWEEIGEKGKRAIVINLPNTYPARPLRGILISGFVALDLERAAYPAALLPLLRRLGYRVDVNTDLGKDRKDEFLKDLFETLEIRMKLFEKLRKERWDLFFFVITGTDRLHHFLWYAYQEEEHPYKEAFLKYYQKVDEAVGKIADYALGKNIPLAILSDHGFTGIKQEVYLNQYLKKWGYLSFDEEAPNDLRSISSSSVAFVLDPSRVYLHLKGKYARGIVEKVDYEKLINELKEAFLSIKIEGKKAIKAVYHKEEIYRGRFLDKAPDLVLHSHYGFDLKAGIRKTSLHGKTHFQGMHTQDNAFLLSIPPLEGLPDHPFIYEIAARIKQYLI